MWTVRQATLTPGPKCGCPVRLGARRPHRRRIKHPRRHQHTAGTATRSGGRSHCHVEPRLCHGPGAQPAQRLGRHQHPAGTTGCSTTPGRQFDLRASTRVSSIGWTTLGATSGGRAPYWRAEQRMSAATPRRPLAASAAASYKRLMTRALPYWHNHLMLTPDAAGLRYSGNQRVALAGCMAKLACWHLNRYAPPDTVDTAPTLRRLRKAPCEIACAKGALKREANSPLCLAHHWGYILWPPHVSPANDQSAVPQNSCRCLVCLHVPFADHVS